MNEYTILGLAEDGFLYKVREELKEKVMADAVEEFKAGIGPLIDEEVEKIIRIRAEAFRNLAEMRDELHVLIEKQEIT